MYLSHKGTITHILKHKGILVVWGLSLTTKKKLSQHKDIKNKIDYIFDTDRSLHNSYYKNILIIHPDTYKKSQNDLIVLWGNHIEDNIQYLKKNNMTNYIVDYSSSSEALLTDIIVKVDKLSKNSDKNDINYIFSQTVTNYIYEHKYLELHIKPYKYITTQSTLAREAIQKQYSDPKKIAHNVLLISYHSIGKKNAQILRWKEGYLQGTIAFDSKGYSGWSSLCDINISPLLKQISLKNANKFFKKLNNRYISNNISKYIQKNDNKFIFPNSFIFFPLQTTNDTVTLHSYFEPIQLIKRIVTILNKKNIPLVIKIHPRCENVQLKKLLIKYHQDRKILLYYGSIHDAISKAQTVYTINSGVGFEALLHLKPVITFGKSDYIHVTKNINDLKSIEKEALYSLNTKEKNKIKKFLYYYMHNKCLFIEDTKKIQLIINDFIIDYLNKVSTTKGIINENS